MATAQTSLQILAKLALSLVTVPQAEESVATIPANATQLYLIFTPDAQWMPIQVWTLQAPSSPDWISAENSLAKYKKLPVAGKIDLVYSNPGFKTLVDTIWTEGDNQFTVQIVERTDFEKNQRLDYVSTRDSSEGDKSPRLNPDSFVVDLLGFQPLWLSISDSSDESDYELVDDLPEEFEVIRFEQLCSKLMKLPLFSGQEVTLVDLL